MRKKLSLVAAGLLAGATLSISAGSPAHAGTCTSWDPTVAYVCRVVGDADPIGWANYYYEEAGKAVYYVYCTLWDPTC